MENLPSWVADYIGLEFESRGRGPKKFDCWGLVRYIYYRQFNIILPSYVDKYTDAGNEKDVSNLILMDNERLNWINIVIGLEKVGDLILLRMKREPTHIGLVLTKSTFLHIHTGIGSVVQMYNEVRWEKRVIGFYRHIRMLDE